MSEDSNSTKKYIQITIGVFLFSMVIGNVFNIKSRMKQIMKMKSPFKIWTEDSKKQYNTNTKFDYKEHFNKEYKQKLTQSTQNIPNLIIPPSIQRSFIELDIKLSSPNKLPTIKETKKAYLKLTRKTHPDILPLGDTKRDVYTIKFKNLSNNYQNCLKFLNEQQQSKKQAI